MTLIRLKYLICDVDRHGNKRYYVRKPGCAKIRVRSVVGTKEFLDEYNRALKEGQATETTRSRRLGENSFGYLCNIYLQSSEARRLSKSTLSWRRRELLALVNTYGEWPYKGVQAANVRKLVDQRAGHPGAARNRLKALKALFKWGVQYGLLDKDPTTGVTFSMPHSDGFATWTDEDVQSFKRKHPS